MRPAGRAERHRRRRRAGRAARPARRTRSPRPIHPVCGPAERLHRPDPQRRDLQPVSRRSAGSKGPAAGCPGPTPPRSSASSAACSPTSPPRRGTTIDLRLVAHPRRLPPRPGRSRSSRRSSASYEAISGRPLPTGPKPFVDDGNSFWALGGVPAITHGPRAGGQHTVAEWVVDRRPGPRGATSTRRQPRPIALLYLEDARTPAWPPTDACPT